jgi:hypothetical protein
VQIFRKHHYAWGGNFLVPDGMHFEWVGEARNTLQYRSRYCPNPPVAKSQPTAASSPRSTSAAVSVTARATMFSQDGWQSE